MNQLSILTKIHYCDQIFDILVINLMILRLSHASILTLIILRILLR